MCLSKNTVKTFYFANKKHIQNFTFESIVLSIQGLQNVQYPSSLSILMKIAGIFLGTL